MPIRPSFIFHWKDHLSQAEKTSKMSGEPFAHGADVSGAAGLKRLGIWVDLLPPGRRTALPHAHKMIEEFIFVVEGAPDVWIDGYLHPLRPGDAVGFPQGTGIGHNVLNNSDEDALLIVVGDRATDDKGYYPVDPDRNVWMREHGFGWPEVPKRELGPHDGTLGSPRVEGDTRPEFLMQWRDIVGADENHYPGSDEPVCYGAEFTSKMELKRIGAGVDIVSPGRRSGWPHAHEEEEEFIFILEGSTDVWVDGEIYPAGPGDCIGFPAGTGIAHTFINNSERDVVYLVLGERDKFTDTRVHYTFHEARNKEIGARHWHDMPKRDLGPHDGKPDALRAKEV